MDARLDRIAVDPAVMGGRPCVRGTRVTVGVVVGLLAQGHETTRVLELYPYLREEDVRQCLAYAAWRSEEQERDALVTIDLQRAKARVLPIRRQTDLAH